MPIQSNGDNLVRMHHFECYNMNLKRVLKKKLFDLHVNLKTNAHTNIVSVAVPGSRESLYPQNQCDYPNAKVFTRES